MRPEPHLTSCHRDACNLPRGQDWVMPYQCTIERWETGEGRRSRAGEGQCHWCIVGGACHFAVIASLVGRTACHFAVIASLQINLHHEGDRVASPNFPAVQLTTGPPPGSLSETLGCLPCLLWSNPFFFRNCMNRIDSYVFNVVYFTSII